MARVVLLWHFHQPDYRLNGRPQMPWVRLHALRGYRDLLIETVEQQLAVTINLVPSLLEQLEDYAAGVEDPHLELTRLPSEQLTSEQRQELLSTFVAGNSAMIQAMPSYARLADRIQRADALTNSDLRDLRMWSTLAWFGATALRDFPELRVWRQQAGGFSETDITRMLAIQEQILRSIPNQIAALGSSRASVTATPYFHPILPLLVNTAHARRSLGDVEDVGFAFPEDAALQLQRARSRVSQAIGRPITGCWPSEGAVSPEVVEIMEQAGFSWFVSDNGVLARSERRGTGDGPWVCGGMTAMFRDHALSDRIGFDAAKQPPQEYACMLAEQLRRRDGIVVLALDGENPWEAFPDAGAQFRETLYAELKSEWMSGDEAAQAPPVGSIQRLHTGSWINADLQIWYGHREDRALWRELARVRQAIATAVEPQRSAALEQVLAAEGSDWMWWAGEEFSTPFASVFDQLFRSRVQAAWRALGLTPPIELDHPLFGAQHASVEPPTDVITPHIPIGWLAAGWLYWPSQGSMARRTFQPLRYGWDDAGQLWVQLSKDRGIQWRLNGQPAAAECAVVGDWIELSGIDDQGSTIVHAKWQVLPTIQGW